MKRKIHEPQGDFPVIPLLIRRRKRLLKAMWVEFSLESISDDCRFPSELLELAIKMKAPEP